MRQLNYKSNQSQVLVHLTNTFQKFNLKTKTLNKTDKIQFYLNFNQFLDFSSIVRQNSMCDLIYFRITDTNILPTYLFWHIVQDFRLNKVRRLAGRDFIGLRNLARHIVYVSGQPYQLSDIGQFVKHGQRANLSIGQFPHNFGEVNLINEGYCNQVGNKVKQ